jgi:hypothetical protein
MTNRHKKEDESSAFLPEIRRARFDKLTIYEISDSELDVLEKGSPDSTYLDFAIGLLSAAIAFSITLATTEITSTKTFSVFTIAIILGYLFGLLLLILWWKNHTSVSSVVKNIRSRLPPEGTSEIIAVSETAIATESVTIEKQSATGEHEA